MKVLPEFPIRSLSGTDERGVRKNYYPRGNLVIQRDVPSGPTVVTSGTVRVRYAWRVASLIWNSLSRAQVEGWNEAAGQMWRVSRFGRYRWTGQNLCTACNYYRHLASVPLELAPPTKFRKRRLLEGTTLTRGLTEHHLTLTGIWEDGIVLDGWHQVRASRPFGGPGRKARKTDVRSARLAGLVNYLLPNQGGTLWFSALEIDQFEYQVGDWVWLWVLALSQDFVPGEVQRVQLEVV